MKRKHSPMKEDYLDKLSIEDQKWLEEFNDDYYYGGVHSEDSMFKSEVAVKEAKDNHDCNRSELFTAGAKKGLLTELNDNTRQFMEDACDEWDWERVYKEFGYSEAVKLIFEQTEEELKNKLIDVKVTLNRFYEKMRRLRRVYKQDRNQKRKQSEKA